MMKKKYVQPACYVVEMEGMDTMCATSLEKLGNGGSLKDLDESYSTSSTSSYWDQSDND